MGFSRDGYDGGVNYTDRYPSMWRYSCIPAGDVNQEVHERMRERLRNEGLHSPETFREILVDGVRWTAETSQMVGADVISIVLKPATKTIDVHFDLSDPTEQVTIREDGQPVGRMVHRLALYTPYALLPNALYSPSVASVGGWRSDDGISFNFIGRPPEVGGGYYGSYVRRPPPR